MQLYTFSYNKIWELFSSCLLFTKLKAFEYIQCTRFNLICIPVLHAKPRHFFSSQTNPVVTQICHAKNFVRMSNEERLAFTGTEWAYRLCLLMLRQILSVSLANLFDPFSIIWNTHHKFLHITVTKYINSSSLSGQQQQHSICHGTFANASPK